MESRLVIFARLLALAATAGLLTALCYFGFREATPPAPVAAPIQVPTAAPVTSSVVARLPRIDPKPVVKVVAREQPSVVAAPPVTPTPATPPVPSVAKAPVVPRPVLRPAPAPEPELPEVATQPPPRVADPLPPLVADAAPEVVVTPDELVEALSSAGN